MKKAIAVVVFALVLACAMALSGCGPKGTMSSDIDDNTGAYTVTTDNATTDMALGTTGGIVVQAGQVLVISPELTSGSLQVKILNLEAPESDNPLVDEKISGTELGVYELAPGDYGVGVNCAEDGTTGTMTIVAVDSAEFEKQNRNLDAVLSAMGSGADSASAPAASGAASDSVAASESATNK